MICERILHACFTKPLIYHPGLGLFMHINDIKTAVLQSGKSGNPTGFLLVSRRYSGDVIDKVVRV